MLLYHIRDLLGNRKRHPIRGELLEFRSTYFRPVWEWKFFYHFIRIIRAE
jgi:hypothetical protein